MLTNRLDQAKITETELRKNLQTNEDTEAKLQIQVQEESKRETLLGAQRAKLGIHFVYCHNTGVS